jgi:uncharacterized membrane protein YdbT with pleckstrin-like domain
VATTREVKSVSTSGAVRADPAREPESALSNRSIEAERQREEFGGLNWGAAFFGWLVAVGIAAILTAFISAAGAAVGLTDISSSEAKQNAATIGIGGAVALLIVLVLAYYAGGYVAGRMSRFAGAIFGSRYNVLSALNLPRIPVHEGTLAMGAGITLAAIVFGTLIAAMLGGRIGRRYHRKVDRVAVI